MAHVRRRMENCVQVQGLLAETFEFEVLCDQHTGCWRTYRVRAEMSLKHDERPQAALGFLA